MYNFMISLENPSSLRGLLLRFHVKNAYIDIYTYTYCSASNKFVSVVEVNLAVRILTKNL